MAEKTKLLSYPDDTFSKIQKEHILGTPLVEILSVTIHPSNGQAAQVFGTIQVVDGEGAVFTLYNRKYDDAESIAAGGGPLTLTLPKGRPICPSDCVNLSVHLEDKNQKSVIAQGTCSWDYKTKRDYDKNQIEKFGGKCGYAILHHVTYAHAVSASVDLLFRGKKDDITGDPVYGDIFGEITAHCGDNSSRLFSRTQNQCLRVMSGTSLDIPKHVVSVPAQCTRFVLAVKLWNSDINHQIICQDLDFFPTHRSILPHRIYIETPIGEIEVHVDWNHLFVLPPPVRKLKNKIERVSDQESLKKQKMIQDDFDQQPSSILSRSSMTDVLPSRKKVIGVLILEVFSVVVRSHHDKGLDLWGLVQFNDWSGNTFDFFNKNQTSIEKLLPNKFLNIAAPKVALVTFDFGIGAYIRDSNGNVICAGELIYGEREVLFSSFPYYDKQLCSVIPGDGGYMAIYYSIFSDAVQANIKVRYEGEKSCIRVNGIIMSEYSNYDYLTWHDKEHYRNRIFENESGVELDENSHLTLSKYIVVVPRDAFLLIDVDLTVSGGIDKKTFKKLLEFKTNVDHKEEQSIQECKVEVEWSEVSVIFPVKSDSE